MNFVSLGDLRNNPPDNKPNSFRSYEIITSYPSVPLQQIKNNSFKLKQATGALLIIIFFKHLFTPKPSNTRHPVTFI